MSFTKGGRGKQAPYETTHVRVPVPMKEQVQSMIEDYKRGVAEGRIDPKQPYVPTVQNQTHADIDRDFVLSNAKQVLSQKKNARVSLLKLVNKLYDMEFTEDDLK